MFHDYSDRTGYGLSTDHTSRIVDEVIIGGKMELLTGLLVGIVAVGIGRCIFGYCKEFSFDVLSSKIGAQIRKDLFPAHSDIVDELF